MPFELIDIPLASGLNGKADSKALQPPSLAVARDIEFDELGGIQTRDQYQAILDAAGNTISGIRKICEYGDELVAFTQDAIWSYSAGDGLWINRGTYLAVKTDEHARFVTTGDQYDCDRAELDGVIMYCWSEATASGVTSYYAAIDSASGAVRKSPTALPATAAHCKLLTTTSKIMLVYRTTNTINVRAFDPSDLTYGAVSQASTSIDNIDACVDPRDPTDILVACTLSTSSYKVLRVSETPSIDDSVSRSVTLSSDGAIAIAADADADELAVVWDDSSGQVDVDFYTSSTFASVATDINLGSSVLPVTDNIAAVYNDSNEVEVFWSGGESLYNSTPFTLDRNIADSGGAQTETVVLTRHALASRAFRYDGETYAWAMFAGRNSGNVEAQLQNTYFLVRFSDGLICARAVVDQGGGFKSNGHLPQVQALGAASFAVAQEYRRIVPTDTTKDYSARSPQDVLFDFDSNEARRTAGLGETLYVSGAIVGQFDGRQWSEVGFHQYPWAITASTGAPGSLTGAFNFKQSFAWHNAKGESERSTSASIVSTSGFSSDKASLTGVPLHATGKSDVSVEFWRQVANADFGEPFYRITDLDPASTGDNRFLLNNPAAASLALTDDIADADLIKLEPFPENGGLTLESLQPPPCSIICSTQERLFAAGIAGRPYRVVYSKTAEAGSIAAFNDFLGVDTPPNGGPVTALAFLSDTLAVFKQSALYVLSGEGFDNGGGGVNYGPARVVSSDVGAVSQEAVALTPSGLLFKSRKGWYLLDHGWGVKYVGGAVSDFDSEEIVACHVMESQHQVRCVSADRMLVWDYLANEWAEWPLGSVSACMWSGEHHIVNAAADGVLAQAAVHNGEGPDDLPQLDVETAWVRTNSIQGFQLARRLLVLGEALGACDVRVRVAYNYDETWVDDKAWSNAASSGVLQFEHGLQRPQCQSVKFRITAQATGSTNPPTSKALNLTALTLEVKRTENSFTAGLGAASKQ